MLSAPTQLLLPTPRLLQTIFLSIEFLGYPVGHSNIVKHGYKLVVTYLHYYITGSNINKSQFVREVNKKLLIDRMNTNELILVRKTSTDFASLLCC